MRLVSLQQNPTVLLLVLIVVVKFCELWSGSYASSVKTPRKCKFKKSMTTILGLQVLNNISDLSMITTVSPGVCNTVVSISNNRPDCSGEDMQASGNGCLFLPFSLRSFFPGWREGKVIYMFTMKLNKYIENLKWNDRCDAGYLPYPWQ